MRNRLIKTTLRFVGGPVDGKTLDLAANIKTVTVPVFPSDEEARGFGQFVYRRCRMDSGEEVLVPDTILDTAGRA